MTSERNDDLGHRADAAECRRLAELLHLDAVGVVAEGGDRRRVAGGPRRTSERAPSIGSSAARRPTGSSARTARTWSSRTSPTGRRCARSPRCPRCSPPSPEPVVRRGVTRRRRPRGPDRARAHAPRVRDPRRAHAGRDRIVLELEWQARRVDVTPDEAIEALTAAADELRKALDEIRGVLASLSPLERRPDRAARGGRRGRHGTLAAAGDVVGRRRPERGAAGRSSRSPRP